MVLEFVIIFILGFVLVSLPLLGKFFPKQDIAFLPGVDWKDPLRHTRLSAFIDEFGYEVAQHTPQRCLFTRTRAEGLIERCEVSYLELDRQKHRFLESEGDVIKDDRGEIMQFDFEIDYAQDWPEGLGFSLAATSEQARAYLGRDRDEAFETVDGVKKGAYCVLDVEEFSEGLAWSAELALQLFLGQHTFSLARVEFWFEWLVTSAVQRDARKLHVTFHLATAGIEEWSLEDIYKTMFKARDLLYERLERVEVGDVMERAYAMIETPFGTSTYSNERALAFMTLQILSRSNPDHRRRDHDALLIAALDARPSEFTYPALIAALNEAQCHGMASNTLVELFQTHRTPILAQALRSRSSVTDMLADARIPGDFLGDELRDAWKDSSCEEIASDARHTHARHALAVLSYCLRARAEDLEHPAIRETIETMLSACEVAQERALLALLSSEDHTSIKGHVDAHMLGLLEAGKWKDAALIQYVLIANDQLPPLQLEAWHQSVSEADTESMRDILLGLDMSDESVLSLWAAFGEHEPHYEALKHDAVFREEVVRRTTQACEQESEISASMALIMARHASVWLSYEDEVFGGTARFNALRASVRALIARLEEAPFDPEVMRLLASLTDRLPPSMTTMISKAIKRWEERRATWSQGALTFVETTAQGALSLGESESQESRSASPEE